MSRHEGVPQIADAASMSYRPARVRCAVCQQIATAGNTHGDPPHVVAARKEDAPRES